MTDTNGSEQRGQHNPLKKAFPAAGICPDVFSGVG